MNQLGSQVKTLSGSIIPTVVFFIGLALFVPPDAQAQTPAKVPEKSNTTTKEAQLKEAEKLSEKVVLLYRDGHYDEAIPLAQKALELREKALGPNHTDVASSLNNLAMLYKEKADYTRTETLLLRALAIWEKAKVPDPTSVALSLNNLALLYAEKTDYARAEPLYLRALAILEKALGADHPGVARLITNLASLYDSKGDYSKAEPLLIRALAIWEKAKGPEHPDVALSLNILGRLYANKGDYTSAEPLFIRALAILEKALDPNHPSVAMSLNILGNLYIKKGDYTRAETLLIRALFIKEKVLGPDHISVGNSLNNIASLYETKGDYTRAEPLYLRALLIAEKALGADHPDLAALLNNLAGLYKSKGDYARAEPLYVRALSIDEKALGPDHPDVATTLNNLAALYDSKAYYTRAEPLYVRALAIWEKALGPNHPDVATTLNNLALLYANNGDYTRAEPLYVRALAIREKALGPDHPDVATSLNNIASLYETKGDYARAEPLYVRALAIDEKSHGPDHPNVATSCRNLGVLYLATGKTEAATALTIRANLISENVLGHIIRGGTERQMLAYSRSIQYEVDYTLSLHLQYASLSPAAREMALLIVLQRKARVLDAQSQLLAALRRHLTAADQKILDELTSVRQMLSAAVLGSPWPNESLADYEKRKTDLREQAEKLEEKLGERASQLKEVARKVTLQAVRQTIPTDSVLLEFAHYKPFDAKTGEYGEPRYAAYGMTKSGIFHADLGPVAPIDAAVADLRNALADSSASEAKVQRLAHRLYRLVLQPMEKHFASAKHLLISPDGQLSLVPFSVLVNGKKRYLIEDHVVTQLTTGRDLLRDGRKVPARSGPVVLVNPQFSIKSPGAAVADPGNDAKGPCGGRDWGELPHTADEGKIVASRLRDTRLLQGMGATEEALKKLRGPQLLHVATHGCFPKVDTETHRPEAMKRGISPERSNAPSPPGETLINTGLLLAGANHHKSPGGSGDGVLTALEAGSLDLWGTQLVVLSACGTGLGDVKSGEGVYGLQRSMMLAGAETVVMSLWSVDDQATRDLMVEYYWRLSQGEGRSEAMRSTQLMMLKRPNQRHPFHWAAFIVSGNWRPMPVTTGFVREPPKTHLAPRGCTCRAAENTTGLNSRFSWALVFLAGVWWFKRRRHSIVF
ncbi:tetratricopeptide repeat protein [Patescibacteria group bacterium]|nr:tetratricopeptide repeat protein [Patescibacteria group bacterium]